MPIPETIGGTMKLQTILKRYSVKELEQAIRYARSDSRRTKLKAEAESLRKQLAKVER
jgi:predicted Ser/Thr protein kinase